jgi:hypothetical protein
MVTVNCENALRALRHKTSPRVLWIDAICINQATESSDLKEKSNQIKLMGQVYHRAKMVSYGLVKLIQQYCISWKLCLNSRSSKR